MVKKSNVKIPFIVVLRTIIFLLIGLALYFSYSNTKEFLTTSQMFAVHDVFIDTSIQFIDVAELRRLKGKNIFKIDIAQLQAKIKSQYPQIAHLQVMRDLPDRIKVLAKKRNPLFQIQVHGKMLLVDTEGVAMYFSKETVNLPLVNGLLERRTQIILGAPIVSKNISLAISIITTLKSYVHCATLKVASLDLLNQSKIEISLVQGIKIILDQDNYRSKMEVLEMLIAQRKVDFSTLKYIDLRFNEPVLGAAFPEQKEKSQ